MQSDSSVIVCATRSPVGKVGGTLSTVPAPQLASQLIRRLLHTAQVPAEAINEIIMGQVLTAGVGQAPARQASRYGGLPDSVCATTIGRVCGSGLKAVMLADQAIRCGDAEVIVAGGQESMSLAPHLLPNSRQGYRFGSVELKDSMQWDGLWDPYNNVSMGECGEHCAREYRFDRAAQDAYARASYERARDATASGHFAKEITPIQVDTKKGKVDVSTDEQPSSVDLDKLSTLRAAFAKDGTITAGNASSINDGAAVLLVAASKAAAARGWKPVARIIAQASVAQDPKWFTTAPVAAIRKVLERASLRSEDIDLFEINEAFAVVAMAAMRDLSLPHERVNAFGGAIALGHPIGASGARILVTLLNGLAARGGRFGLATLCIGGGEASAMIVERI